MLKQFDKSNLGQHGLQLNMQVIEVLLYGETSVLYLE